jgi:L-xylulokinase
MGIFDLASEMAGSGAPGAQEIVFLPHIYGSNDNPLARACFVGLQASHSRAQIVRAVFEGIALGHRVHVERLLKSRSRPLAVRLAGGAAKSPVWTRIFADVLGLPIEVVDAEELGTLGCAMAAAVASGEYTDLSAAAKNMVKIKGRIEPDGACAAVYDRKFSLHKEVTGLLDGIWQRYAAAH